jgi:hypothetical protein
MPAAEQQRAGCVIGRDTSAPIVDHVVLRALALFRQVALPERHMR